MILVDNFMDQLSILSSNVLLPEDYTQVLTDVGHYVKHSTGPMKR